MLALSHVWAATYHKNLFPLFQRIASGFRGSMGFQPKPSAVVILNVCPQPALREARAKLLRNAGYLPASAGTAEEAASLATSVICSGAIICYSFKPDERRLIRSQIEEILPATKIIQLSSEQKNDPLVLLSSVRDVLDESNYAKAA